MTFKFAARSWADLRSRCRVPLAFHLVMQVLPAYEGSHNVTLSAVYPSRQFLPAKVRLFIDFLAELYGPVPYWER